MVVEVSTNGFTRTHRLLYRVDPPEAGDGRIETLRVCCGTCQDVPGAVDGDENLVPLVRHDLFGVFFKQDTVGDHREDAPLRLDIVMRSMNPGYRKGSPPVT